ncbi:hypothetical protein MXB_416 [Myxobolus squamalis]|nr:hypothetical protein MXB_416 [Myxobolus squamalis]
MTPDKDQHMYWIDGIQVIQALKKSKNCLIESPTGTGKTLALLCASGRKINIANNSKKISESRANIPTRGEKNSGEAKSEYFEEDDDDFLPTKVGAKTKCVEKNIDSRAEELKKPEADDPDTTPCKIYYCTRTHRQIAQVVSEFRRSKYGNGSLKMSILSSRKLSCLNAEVKKSASLTDACRQITNKTVEFKNKCSFFLNVSLSDTHKKLRNKGFSSVWNLEEIMEFSQGIESCPYFSCQKLAENSDIVFAPYNYVMNPIISEQMSLNTKNSIIILDEAHNIEDICRSAMSACFFHSRLISCFKELTNIYKFLGEGDKFNALKIAYTDVSSLISFFANWVLSFDGSLCYKSVTVQEKVLSGKDFKSSIESHIKMNADGLNSIIAQHKKITASYSQDELDMLPRATDSSQQTMSSIMLVLEYVIIKATDNFVVSMSKGSQGDLDMANNGFLLTQASDIHEKSLKKLSLNNQGDILVSFVCLTPSLAFNYVTKNCRSVILASGTLSPISSFAPELGVPFDLAFQTSNYLQPGQAAVFSLGVDTSNHPLRLTYKNIDSLKHQDEVECVKLLLEAFYVSFPPTRQMGKYIDIG